MKHSIAYLPKHKQHDLQRLVKSIRALLPQAEMIILYGSYATGKYVEYDERVEFGIPTTYMSDYDLLVVTHNIQYIMVGQKLDTIEDWYHKDSELQTPVQFIHDDIEKLNSDLSEGRFFYTQLKQEGVVLYDSGNFKLVRRRKLKYGEIKQQAEEYYKEKYSRASEFYEIAEYTKNKNYLPMCSFNLHQVCENLFHAVRLVFTLKNPKQHNLAKILAAIKKYSPDLVCIFPRNTTEEKRLFKLVKDAYVEARYNPAFEVSKDDIDVLMVRVERLFELVKRICEAQIAAYNELSEEAQKQQSKPS